MPICEIGELASAENKVCPERSFVLSLAHQSGTAEWLRYCASNTYQRAKGYHPALLTLAPSLLTSLLLCVSRVDLQTSLELSSQ
jgi:hypothetical protein